MVSVATAPPGLASADPPADREMDLLRFITCGSVDDGKSTLIGRLLYESKSLLDDQLATLAADSRRIGTQGEALDFALLVDGLAAEREQGITIDVAYRYFATAARKFIVADTPGHEQYTRNMVTGASTADLAILLVDATKGLQTQTRRHAYLVSLLGIRRIVLAVNKMDLVDYAPAVHDRISADFAAFAAALGLDPLLAIPVSALTGENIAAASPHMPWYAGPSLLDHLNEVPLDAGAEGRPFRMPVQWVNRPTPAFRGFSGLIASGIVSAGDRVRAVPSGQQSLVARIVTADGDLVTAVAGQSVSLVLEPPIDVSRGDVLADAAQPPEAADQFEATLIWMATGAMLPGRPYLMKLATKTVVATVTAAKFKVNVNNLEHLPAKSLGLNEIGVCNLSLDQPIAFEPYRESRTLGGFILIDRTSNETVGAGLLNFALRRAQNIHWQPIAIDQTARAALKGQKPCVLWFTGLSGAGKSTIANLVEQRLVTLGRHTALLDGDNVRHGLNKDLGFTDADRVENIRRVAEVARLMVEAGLIVLVSFISPFRAERRMARELMQPGSFIEIFVDTPLAIAEARDVKGLYKKARSGALRNFTGIDSPYETPEQPDIRVNTSVMTAEAASDLILRHLLDQAII